LAQRFLLGTLVIMLAGMFGISGWVGGQIEAGVIRQSGTTAALLLDSFVTPQLQGYAQKGTIDPQHAQMLDALLKTTPLGKWVVAFTVRDMSGRVLFSTDPTITNVTGPTTTDLAAAAAGQVTSTIDRLEKDTDSPLRKYSDRLVKTYSPVREYNSGRIFAVTEFYQDVDTLQTEIDTAKRRSWYVVGAFMLGMYALLALFSKRSSDTIDRQQQELRRQVMRLTELLDQNRRLHERVRRAAASVAGLHERLLRRIGSELHDGPAQDLSLALMQMDIAIAQSENGSPTASRVGLLTGIQSALQNALAEMRGIAAGLALPQLAALSPMEVFEHAARAHEKRTHTSVELKLNSLPGDLPLPTKIVVYRLVQEALNNSFKHAGGAGQQVCAEGSEAGLLIQVSDQGPGFAEQQAAEAGDHLGLVGMRERVESLGGTFEIHSMAGRGTTITALLSLPKSGGSDD
jgi:signal transduction histidine kinase